MVEMMEGLFTVNSVIICKSKWHFLQAYRNFSTKVFITYKNYKYVIVYKREFTQTNVIFPFFLKQPFTSVLTSQLTQGYSNVKKLNSFHSASHECMKL